jgi:hypothetical protein
MPINGIYTLTSQLSEYIHVTSPFHKELFDTTDLSARFYMDLYDKKCQFLLGFVFLVKKESFFFIHFGTKLYRHD